MEGARFFECEKSNPFEQMKREVTQLNKVSLIAIVMALLLATTAVCFGASTDSPPAEKLKASEKGTAAEKPQDAAKAAEADKPSEAAKAEEATMLLKPGMRNSAVAGLQYALTKAGVYGGAVDGLFGDSTQKSVESFQRIHGLSVDGIVGKETWMYLDRAAIAPSRYSRELTMRASAYTAFDPGNGNFTSRGNPLHKGLVAVDPYVIPLGTRLYIPGYGYAVADDTGGAIKGNRIDLAFDSRSEALQFGVQYVKVYILD